jgi:hypothetical protein
MYENVWNQTFPLPIGLHPLPFDCRYSEYSGICVQNRKTRCHLYGPQQTFCTQVACRGVKIWPAVRTSYPPGPLHLLSAACCILTLRAAPRQPAHSTGPLNNSICGYKDDFKIKEGVPFSGSKRAGYITRAELAGGGFLRRRSCVRMSTATLACTFFHNEVSPDSRVLLAKLTVPHLVDKLPKVHRSSPRVHMLTYINLAQIIRPIHLRSTLILSYNYAVFQVVFFLQVCQPTSCGPFSQAS